MLRVSDEEVKQILSTTIDTTPFIETAHVLVEEVFTTAGHSEDRLTKIELWLSAHFACMMDPRESEVEAGAKAVFEGKTGMYLNFTRYGQMAMVLDTSGVLASLSTGKVKGRVTVAPRTEQPLVPDTTV